MGHFFHRKEVCSCGAVIDQCRCFDVRKPTIVVENGCQVCQELQRNAKKIVTPTWQPERIDALPHWGVPSHGGCE